MPPIRHDQPLVASVLDRLLDDAPETTTEPARSRAQLLRDLKQSVRRDIEDLLNTRRRAPELPPGFAELEQSLLAYGLADFSGTGPATAKEREAFCRSIEAVIRRHEPRLFQVAVAPAGEPADRTLRFKIDALLRADPAPEPVVFDSALDPALGEFAVKGG